MSNEKIMKFYKEVVIEQDKNSPHRYIEDFEFIKDKIVIEIGAAEGSFSLNCVDLAKKIYIFECDKNWNEALNNTFKPYGEKVRIINKYVSDRNSEDEVTLDSFIANAINLKEIDSNYDKIFIKMDIEGMEMKALNGIREFINSDLVQGLSICTYHHQNDEKDIRKYLENYNFNFTTSKGFMVFAQDKDIEEPYFRRGVLRAMKL